MHTNVCSGKTEKLGKGVVDLDIDGRVINLKICRECVNCIQLAWNRAQWWVVRTQVHCRFS